MKRFDQNFRAALREAVEEVEKVSGVEVVATIMPRVHRYWLPNMIVGATLAFLVLTLLMFIHIEYWYVLIYLETLAAFGLGFLLLNGFPSLKRRILGKKYLEEQVELRARALFQQAGIVETRERVGTLLVFSWFERHAVIIRDTGAEEMVPPDEWEALEAKCRNVFSNDDPAKAIVNVLKESKECFRTYIPRSANDVNELPDELWLQ